MDQIIITKKNTTTWALITKSAVTSITKGEQKRTLLDEDVVTMTVESAIPLTFDLGDKITIYGSTYTLNALPKLLKAGKRKFTYDITWEGRQYDLLRAICFDIDETEVSISSDFSLTGDLTTFMGVLINNLERVYGTGSWVMGDRPAMDCLTLSYSNQNCLAVLQDLCNEKNFNKEFEIIEESGICTINIKAAIGQNLSQTYEYGKGKGLYSLTRETVSDKNIITRLYAFGANKNLASNYRGFSQRLKLSSNDLSYIEDAVAKAAFGHIEDVKIFDDIFPHRTGTVTSLGATVYEFLDGDMDFDLNATSGGNTLYLISGTAAKIHFNTGNLAGYEFEISSYNHSTKTFIIKAFKDERGQAFPDPATSAFQISAGDKYVIVDIMLPQSYINTAESALLAAAQTYLSQNCQPRVQYALTIDQLYLIALYPGSTIVNVYNVGDYLPIEDSDIAVDKSIRVKSFTRDLLRHYLYTLSLSDIVETSILQRMLAKSIETAKIIVLNKLNDVARAKRSWQSTRELLDMVFDTDGYFDGSNIKPNSIETLMLSVGTRSQQLALNAIIEPNYQGVASVVNVTAGILSHYAIEAAIRDWNISGGQVTLTQSGAYYIYGKCIKVGTSGIILFSQSQIKVDDDANYYHFLLGILHAIVNSVRWISLTEGSTVINGRYIKTGKITSQDGSTWFDLDTGEMHGVINITNGSVPNSVVTGLGSLALKSSVDLSSAEVANKSLANVDNTANSKLNGIAAGATVGATWGTNLSGIPAMLVTPSGSGLYLSSAYLGYYDGGAWLSYIDNAGNCKFVGIVEFGTKATGAYDNARCIAIKDNQIYEPLENGDGGSAGIDVNKYGYQGGNSWFRCFSVYDGKGSKLMACQGNSPIGRTIFYQSLEMSNDCKVSLSDRHTIVTGTTDIQGSATEIYMTNMSLSITPKGAKIFIMFEAPFYSSDTNWVKLRMIVGGSSVRKCYSVIHASGVSVSFQHIANVTPGSAVTVAITWQCANANPYQYGSTYSERILTVVDLM